VIPRLILAALMVALAPAYAASAVSPASIDSLEDIELGGTREKILIQGDDQANPLLLWLHGGPGEPAMLLSHHFSGTLKKHFTIVHWDQPGAGLSYEPKHPLQELSEARIQRDALELTDRLRRRFGRTKIYLLGHSFGTVIGTRLVAQNPDRFCAYIGMGQLVNGTRSFELTRNWLKTEMTKTNDLAGLAALPKATDMDVFEMVRARGGILHQKVDYRAIINSSPYYFDGYWEQKQEAKALVVKLLGTSVGKPVGPPPEGIHVLKVPAFYFEGRFDRIPATAPELVVEYVAKLKAPYKEIVWFENSGHLPNLDEPQAFQNAIIDRVLGKTRGCGLAR
jgi:pimeloyl-ACP methyl ester carboxylesterase